MRFNTTGSRSRTPHERRGYVLLMTLALLVIAVISEGGLARRSLRTALAAAEAQAELQRRWGASSCRELLLANAENLFIANESASNGDPSIWPADNELAAEVMLGSQTVKLRLADEEARLNINAVQARSPATASLVITDLTGGRAPLALRPDMSPEARRRRQSFVSWGQVFNLDQLLSQDDAWNQLLAATHTITCWGDGKVNVRRGTDEAIAAAVATVADRTTAQKIIDARRQFAGDLLLDRLLATLKLRRAEQIKLQSVLTDRSSCYSLWLTLGDGKRQWYYLWIQGDRSGRSPTAIPTFIW